MKKYLVPSLEAGGAEVLIDYRQFQGGRNLIGQMDETQDQADINLLVITPAYLESKACMHEMDRAIKCDPDFSKGIVVPVIKETCPSIPESLTTQNQPLYINLGKDNESESWERLFNACKSDLGMSPFNWLEARDEICQLFDRNVSVNLIIRGKRIQWRQLLNHIQEEYFPDLGIVRLANGATASRWGLVQEILKALNMQTNVPINNNEDLVTFSQAIERHSAKSRLALTDFDLVRERPDYDWNLFAALRDLLTESRKLVLLIVSRMPFSELLPPNNPLSSVGASSIHCVELRNTR